jgi:hypothetical protein
MNITNCGASGNLHYGGKVCPLLTQSKHRFFSWSNVPLSEVKLTLIFKAPVPLVTQSRRSAAVQQIGGISAVSGFDDKVRDRNFSVSNVVVDLTGAQTFTGFVCGELSDDSTVL